MVAAGRICREVEWELFTWLEYENVAQVLVS